MLVPERVTVPPVKIRLPVRPLILPALVPAETVSAVLPRVMVPPLRVAIEDVAPLRISVPVVRVVMVATPLTVVEPLEELKVVIAAVSVIVFVPPVMELELRVFAATVPPPKAVSYTHLTLPTKRIV